VATRSGRGTGARPADESLTTLPRVKCARTNTRPFSPQFPVRRHVAWTFVRILEEQLPGTIVNDLVPIGQGNLPIFLHAEFTGAVSSGEQSPMRG